MDKAAIDQAIVKAKALVASLEAYDGTALHQLAILKEADGVRASLEQPYDTAMRWVENMTPFSSLNIINRIGVYSHFPEDAPGDATVSATELASACRCDVSIVNRAMRMAIYNGVFIETGPDVYAHNDLSRAFGPRGLGGFFGVGSDLMKAWLCLPEYVASHTPEDLYDVRKTPSAFAEGHEGKTYYELQALNPERRLLWNLTLQSMEKNFPILGMFPFKDLTAVTDGNDRPVIVDVGGGRGQALLKIREDCGDVFDGRMILQDLPVVIDSLEASELPGIQPMKYDIFTPQLVKNAHVYFLRRLLHDFYDSDVKSILRNTASAMGPDSRLIVSDMLLPDTVQRDGPSTSYWLDLSLLAIGGRERNMATFLEIFAEVGLELVNTYRSEGTDVAMLETRLKRAE